MAGIKRIGGGTWKITEWGKFFAVNMFLAAGSERAVLVDSGYGNAGLPRLIKKVCDKPVIIINTHGHLDHAGGNYHFDSYLPKGEKEVYAKHTSPEFLKGLKMRYEFPPNKTRELDFDDIDLGGRRLEIIQTPGHTSGSVSVLDEAAKSLYIGDLFNPYSAWLGMDESVSVAVYKTTLEALLKLARERGITKIWSGHSLGAMKQSAIQNHIDCCGIILKGGKKFKYTDNGLNKGYVTKYKNAVITWRSAT